MGVPARARARTLRCGGHQGSALRSDERAKCCAPLTAVLAAGVSQL